MDTQVGWTARLQHGLRLIGELRDHLMLVRIPLLIVISGAVLTLWVDQIKELFFLLGQSASRAPLHGASAIVMSLALGLAVWYTSRILFRFEYPARPFIRDGNLRGLRIWLPRLLGALVPALMALGCFGELARLVGQTKATAELINLSRYGIGFAFSALLLFLLVSNRRRLVLRFFHMTIPPEPRGDKQLLHFRELERPGQYFLGIGTIVNGLLLVLAYAWPAGIGWMGPLAVILLTALCFTLTGGLVLIYTERFAFPILTIALLWTFLLQTLHLDDNHHVRQAASAKSWRTQAADVTAPPAIDKSLGVRVEPSRGRPVFLVSAEGGGIRAAAWTALVLSRLQNLSGGEFSTRYIAGSGVSGGSLGLATFSATLAQGGDEFNCEPTRGCAAQRFLTQDFLGATLTNMLLIDQAQRFLPGHILPDRGSQLEKAWETAWTEAVKARDGGFAEGWRRLTGADGEFPLLLLNSTRVDDGQRFIQQPMALLPSLFARLFPGATDGARWLSAEAPLSAIIHNSARFTYISPAGTLDPPNNFPDDTVPIQLVDGGYFENSGAATLEGVFRLLTAGVLGEGGLQAIAKDDIYVIHISNDPGLAPLLDDEPDRCTPQKPRDDPVSVQRYGEIAAPLLALLDTREARGEIARRALKAAGCKDHFFHFRLCEGTHHLPLGWTLSQEAWSEMYRQSGGAKSAPSDTPNVEANRVQLDKLMQLIHQNERSTCDPEPAAAAH